MDNIKVKFRKNNIDHTGIVDLFTKEDLLVLKEIYFSWKDTNEKICSLGSRRMTLPEILSEGLACVLFDLVRVNGKNNTTLKSNSFDCLDIKNGDTYQIKAVSTLTEEEIGGPTSFGPKSEYDKLVLMHFICNTDEVKCYLFNDNIKDIKVNKNETFEEQCLSGRRPRFSLLEKILDLNIEPYCSFNWRMVE